MTIFLEMLMSAYVPVVHAHFGPNGKSGTVALPHVEAENVVGLVVVCMVLDAQADETVLLLLKTVMKKVVQNGTIGVNGNSVPKHAVTEPESDPETVMAE